MGFMTTERGIDFGNLMARLAERVRPSQEKKADVQKKYHAWFQRELERGGTVSSSAPEEVDLAIAAAVREGQQAARRFFAEHEPAMRADLDRCAHEADAAYQNAVEKLMQLRDTEA